MKKKKGIVLVRLLVFSLITNSIRKVKLMSLKNSLGARMQYVLHTIGKAIPAQA
jgi:hypothetical protein